MQFLNPCNDVAFKKIFGSEEHKSVTISFLNSILEYTGEQQITDVQFLNTEQKRIIPGKKDNILDILCIDQLKNQYIVEVQVAGMEEFDKRVVFYGAKTYALQLSAAQSYQTLNPKEDQIPAPLNNNEFRTACQTANRMTWTESEYNAYENAIIAADDAIGKINFALKEAKLDTIKRLLSTNKLTIEEIAQITGAPVDQVNEIKKNS